MEGGLVYHIMASCGLLSLGMYHIFSASTNHLRSPRDYSAKPYHPLPASLTSRRHAQLHLLIAALTLALIHQLVVSSESDPLLKGRTPVHLLTSLQSAAVLLLFLLLSLSLLLSETTSLLPLPLPPDLLFALASALFYLDSSVAASSAAVQTSALQARCDALSARVSALSSLLCLALACLPRLFAADVGLGASLCLQGLWALQAGLSLHVDAFIPQGCHRLLDVASGVEGSTRCDLDDSTLRAVAVLDLLFAVHVVVVVVIVLVAYGAVARFSGGRRFGGYEALPTVAQPASASASAAGAGAAGDPSHIQMKALAGTQA